MVEEEKGFVIKDRRAFDQKGDLKEETSEKSPGREPPAGDTGAGEEKPEAQKGAKRGAPPLPPVTFSSLILSLSSSALFNLGEIPDPQTGEKRKDLELAKHGIDTLAMLKEKSAGNLNSEEQNLLENILTDLRWRYVKAVQ